MAGITTNCGTITPQSYTKIQDIVCSIPGANQFTHNNLTQFYRTMCQWAYNIPLNFQWVLFIIPDDIVHLTTQIKTVIPKFESQNWDMKNTMEKTWTEETQEAIGCIFAQSVELPGEKSIVERAGMPEGSNRGFIKAPIINGREDFSNLSVTFLETNLSFVDGFIRPWNIIVNHQGLIAREKSIKSKIHVFELAKTGACTPNIIRKQWVFNGAVPIMISEEQKSQEATSDYGKRQTQFVFDSYYLEDSDTVNAPKLPPNRVPNNYPPIENNNPIAGASMS
jgi:hypothetical protein